jgi:hypothetical protein
VVSFDRLPAQRKSFTVTGLLPCGLRRRFSVRLIGADNPGEFAGGWESLGKQIGRGDSKTQRELRGHGVAEIARTGVFVLEAVLKLEFALQIILHGGRQIALREIKPQSRAG